MILDCRWRQTTTEQQNRHTNIHTIGRPPRSNTFERRFVSSTKLDFSVGSFDFRLQAEDNLISECRWRQTTTEQQNTFERTFVSSTKLDFSVGSFDFRLQVEDHLIVECRWRQTTTEQRGHHLCTRIAIVFSLLSSLPNSSISHPSNFLISANASRSSLYILISPAI